MVSCLSWLTDLMMILIRDGHIQILKINVSIFPDVGERCCLCPQKPTLTLSGLWDTFMWSHNLYLLCHRLPWSTWLVYYFPAVSSTRFYIDAWHIIFKYYNKSDLLWTLELSMQFLALPDPCVMDRWSWITIINLQTHHASNYSVDFASLLPNRGHSENPSSRVLHLRTSGKTSERRSSAEAAARSLWRCRCCSLPLLHTSLARSSVRLDRNAVK